MIKSQIMECRGFSKDLNEWVYGTPFIHCTCAIEYSYKNTYEYEFEHQEGKIIAEEFVELNKPKQMVIFDVDKDSMGYTTPFITFNGYRLYENDIVELTRFERKEINYYFKINRLDGEFVLTNLTEPEVIPLKDVYEHLKILGNTYENPELLSLLCNNPIYKRESEPLILPYSKEELETLIRDFDSIQELEIPDLDLSE